VEAGVQGMQLHTQYLTACFDKLSGKKEFENLTKFDQVRGKTVSSQSAMTKF